MLPGSTALELTAAVGNVMENLAALPIVNSWYIRFRDSIVLLEAH